MISWEYFISRRRISEAEYCQANGIDSYSALIQNLSVAGVWPPSEEQYSAFMPKPVIIPAPPVMISQATPDLVADNQPEESVKKARK